MFDLIREAPVGQAIRYLTRNKYLRYPEEEPGFDIPPQYTLLLRPGGNLPFRDVAPSDDKDNSPGEKDGDDVIRPVPAPQNQYPDLEMLGRINTTSSVYTAPYTTERMRVEQSLEIERTRSVPIIPQKTLDNIVLVDWYTTDDPANPQNWSSSKKSFIVAILAFYTWAVYCTGPIWAAAQPGMVEHFGISEVAASLGLSLYVLAYGIGDLVFSPLTEIPIVSYCLHLRNVCPSRWVNASSSLQECGLTSTNRSVAAQSTI